MTSTTSVPGGPADAVVVPDQRTVCLVGDFSAARDEGYKNVAHSLASAIAASGWSVSRMNVKEVTNRRFFVGMPESPTIVHILSQPTSVSLLLLRLMKLRWPQAKFVLSALRADQYLDVGNPIIKWTHIRLLEAMRPHALLLQSAMDSQILSRSRIRVAMVPNGVDTRRFVPVPAGARAELRVRHHIDRERPVVLHVGHLRRNRNLMALAPLLTRGIQVVVIGGTYLGTDEAHLAQLRGAGFLVFEGYRSDVHEFYQLADCYAFPVEPGVSLSMPLTILEAMSTNLRVVATPYRGIEHWFTGVDGLDLCAPERISDRVLESIGTNGLPNTRAAVTKYSWAGVSRQLTALYENLLRE